MESLGFEPPLRASDWCKEQPCLEIGDWVISQLSSSVIVYVVATISVLAGRSFLLRKNRNRSEFY